MKTPQRHVRTRLYFTSESHIHSLINVLRYCHLDEKLAGQEPLISDEALHRLYETKELDYLTHIVLRLYENTEVRLLRVRRSGVFGFEASYRFGWPTHGESDGFVLFCPLRCSAKRLEPR